jgi:hypothetical protein
LYTLNLAFKDIDPFKKREYISKVIIPSRGYDTNCITMKHYALNNHLQSITLGKTKVYGHYVYEWLDNGKPFYIGSGTNRRAWNTHNPLAEAQRRNSTNFRVVIHKQYLSKQMAHLEERILTMKRLSQGFTLTNERLPCLS